MVRFNLPSLPEGSVIESAKLRLYVKSVAVQNLASRPLQLHRITSSWTEGGVTWNSKPSFDGASLDSIQFSALSAGTWVTFDVPVNVVEGWYANPSSNYGLLLKRNPDGAPGSSALKKNNAEFTSSEGTAAQRPKLEVTYSYAPPPSPGTVTISKFQAETSAGYQGTFDTVSDQGSVTITGPDINPLPQADPFTVTWTFNVALDLDGWRGNNDSMTVDMEIKSDLASGPGKTELMSQWGTDTAKTAYFVVGPGDGIRINGDEVVTFTPRAVTYSLNGGAAQNGTFAGFLSANVQNLTGGSATIGGETVGGIGTVMLPSRPTALEASAGGVVRYRLTDISFQISTNAPVGDIDSDGDGAPDGDELVAGTDPNNPDSVCRADYGGRRRRGRFEWDDAVSWPSVAGREYDVQRSFDLTGGWETVLIGIAADPPRNEVTLPIDASTPSAVYRIVVHWPDAP